MKWVTTSKTGLQKDTQNWKSWAQVRSPSTGQLLHPEKQLNPSLSWLRICTTNTNSSQIRSSTLMKQEWLTNLKVKKFSAEGRVSHSVLYLEKEANSPQSWPLQVQLVLNQHPCSSWRGSKFWSTGKPTCPHPGTSLHLTQDMSTKTSSYQQANDDREQETIFVLQERGRVLMR